MTIRNCDDLPPGRERERHVRLAAEAIEAAFMARRERPADLAGAFNAAFAPVLADAGTEPVAAALHRAGAGIVAAVDQAAAQNEPAYHNRYHMAEAVLAMGWLCRHAWQTGLISVLEGAVGIVAMAGHDLQHDGSSLGGGVLEARARALVLPIAAASGVPAAMCVAIGAVILATDPAMVARNRARVAGQGAGGGSGHDWVCVMANEADVCGSLLPVLGPRLSACLADEWRAGGHGVLLDVGLNQRRLMFLETYASWSAPARAMGLDVARRRSLDAVRALMAA